MKPPKAAKLSIARMFHRAPHSESVSPPWEKQWEVLCHRKGEK